MRSRRRLLITFSAVVFLWSINAPQTFSQRPPDAGQIFTGKLIPSPPKQNSPWSPPKTALAEKFVTATVALFNQGLTDPRDCEYREVEVFGAGVWGDTGIVKFHGWVLPRANEQQGQFAVGWNGLVYPVIAVHDAANLRADIEATIRKDEERRAQYKLEHPDFPFYRFRSAISNYGSLSQDVLLPVKSCLLLRLGESLLAEQLWNTWAAGMDAKVNDDAIHLSDPYMMLATEWLWALFDRAVTAHMDGDDKLAMLSAAELSRIQPVVEAEADRRHITPRRQEYFRFLDPLLILLADEQSRVTTPVNSFSLQTDLKIADQQLRVAALIRDLEEVSARQWGQPGGVSLREDPIVQAIIAQGETAVEPLISVIETDTRLTRSVSFSRNFHYDRHLIGVHEAAYTALVEILKTTQFSSTDNNYDLLNAGMPGRKKLAADIRSYLKEFGNLPREERWYRILKDDAANGDQWVEAAAFIIQPSDRNYLPPSWAFTGSHAPGPGDAFQLRGEPLRAKTNPTVSELFIRRMNELSQRAAGDNWYPTMQKAVDFGLALGTWEGSKSLPQLQQFTGTLINEYASLSGKPSSRQPYLISFIVYLVLKRGELKDAPAISEYAVWLQTVKPAETEYETVLLFIPALRYPETPEIQSAITHMLLDPHSSWNPLILLSQNYPPDSKESVGSLMEFRAFREAVLRGLADKTVVGTLTPRPASPNDKYDLKIENATAAAVAGAMQISSTGTTTVSSTVVNVARSDRRPAAPLSPVAFRVCDVYALKLRGFVGAPAIQLYWSESERDAAVEGMIEFVRNHAGKFVYSPERAYKYTQ
jgi:hypothetical protein